MVNKVTLLGREFRLGIGFLNKLIDGTGKDLLTLGNEVQTNSPVIVPLMMYWSLAYADHRNGKDISHTINDVYDLIDENGGTSGKFWSDFLTAFAKSMNQDVPVEDKKKVAKPKR